MIKHIFLILLLLVGTLFAETDLRLNHYPKAIEWLQDADTNGESAYNIGVLYHKEIKDNDKAIEWYEKAYSMNDSEVAGSAANNIGSIYDDLENYQKSINWYENSINKNYTQAFYNLGILYKKLHRYDDAIFYYKKSYKFDHPKAAHNLALIYEENLKNKKESIKWYRKSSHRGYPGSIKNLARYYKLEKDDNIMGGAYFLALIDIKYPKQKVLSYLKTKWNLTDEEIKKAYQLQKTLDIPKHYYDPEFEDKNTKKTGRH